MGIKDEGEAPLLLSGDDPDEREHQQLLHIESNGGDWVRKTWLESKKMWQIAGPSIFSRLAMFSITVVTQSFAGHLGDLELAAISVGTTVIISISFGFLLGMASALETLCGQAYGAKQYHMLGIYMQRSWIVLFACAIFLLPMFVFATPLLKFIGQPENVADETGLVALWLIPFHLSFPFQFTLQRFLQSQLKTGVIAWVSGGAFVLHLLVSWIFVYKLRVGIEWTALSIGFSWWVSVFGMFAYVIYGGCANTWTGFSVRAFHGLWQFFKLAVASGVMLLLENFYYRVLIIVSGYLHNAEVAVDALSICVSIYGWESMIPLGFLAATGVRVANELGAGNGKGAKFATGISVMTSMIVGLLFWLIIMIFHEKLAMIFTSSVPVVSMIDELSVFLALTILLNCIQPVLSGVAVGFGWQALVAFINVGSYYLIGVPLGILMGWWSSFGFKGLWGGMICGTVIQTIVLAIVTIRCEWEDEALRAQIHAAEQAASNQDRRSSKMSISCQIVFCVDGGRAIWGGMLCGGAGIQTVILAIITIRTDWEKEAEKSGLRVPKWSIPPPPSAITDEIQLY